MLKVYIPDHSLNRMGHEGDVVNARKVYLSGSNKNLEHLLRNRFSWMNDFVSTADRGVELGAGIGASRDFLNVESLLLTDFLDSDWLDKKNIDALNTGLDSGSFDFVVASNMIHHLAFPKNFFEECYRILKPGGKLIIQEIHSSLMMRTILRLMRHEGFDETINVFSHDKPCNLVNDPWSANCSVPKLLFSSHLNFERVFPDWRVIHDRKVEFFQFLNSGGVIAKTFYIPLSPKILVFQDKVDRVLNSLLPDFFALQRQIVLEKASSHN
jgi:SAM-dependent methyltransferase